MNRRSTRIRGLQLLVLALQLEKDLKADLGKYDVQESGVRQRTYVGHYNFGMLKRDHAEARRYLELVRGLGRRGGLPRGALRFQRSFSGRVGSESPADRSRDRQDPDQGVLLRSDRARRVPGALRARDPERDGRVGGGCRVLFGWQDSRVHRNEVKRVEEPLDDASHGSGMDYARCTVSGNQQWRPRGSRQHHVGLDAVLRRGPCRFADQIYKAREDASQRHYRVATSAIERLKA